MLHEDILGGFFIFVLENTELLPSTSFPGFSPTRPTENPGKQVVSQSAIGQFFSLFIKSLRSLSYVHEQLHTLFTGSHCDS